MKNLLFFIGLILASAPMFGYDFESNGLYYNIVETSSVEVTYGDEIYSGEFSIPEKVYNSGKEYEVIANGELPVIIDDDDFFFYGSVKDFKI